MFNSLTILDKIILDPPATQIYSRLGFKKKITDLSSSRQKETDCYIREAAALIALRGVFYPIPILKNDGRTTGLAGGLSFESKKLASFLDGCRDAVLIGATAGASIMEAIREKTAMDQMTAAVVYDAAASEMADAALDWIMGYINRQLRRDGRCLLPRRFSAGYADFKLENQSSIFEMLQMEKIGVTLTPSFLLLPEKSLTAICGIP